MFSKKAAWLSLIWAIAWFGAIVPMHQRGQIKLDQAASSCCQEKCPTESSDSDDDKPVDSTGHCAVCFLIAHLDTPSPAMVTLAIGEKVVGHVCVTGHARPTISDQPVDCDRGPPALV